MYKYKNKLKCKEAKPFECNSIIHFIVILIVTISGLGVAAIFTIQLISLIFPNLLSYTEGQLDKMREFLTHGTIGGLIVGIIQRRLLKPEDE